MREGGEGGQHDTEVYKSTDSENGGGAIGNNAMCVILPTCVLLLVVWGYGPLKNNCFFMPYKVVYQAILELSKQVCKYITAVTYVQ